MIATDSKKDSSQLKGTKPSKTSGFEFVPHSLGSSV
jgi:hypothetical protein